MVLELRPLIPTQAENIIRLEAHLVGVLFVLLGKYHFQEIPPVLLFAVIGNQMFRAALFLQNLIFPKGIGENCFPNGRNHHPGYRFATEGQGRGGARALGLMPPFTRRSGIQFGISTQKALSATSSIQMEFFSSVFGPRLQIFSHVRAQPCGWKLWPGALHQRNTLPPSSAPNTWKISIPILNHCSREQSEDCVFRSSKTFCCFSVISWRRLSSLTLSSKGVFLPVLCRFPLLPSIGRFNWKCALISS